MTPTTVLAFCVTLSLMVTTGVHGTTCTIRGDPHVGSFAKSIQASLPFPCIYLAAHLTYSTDSGDVHVKVYTSSGLDTFHGRYFVDEVKVVVDDDAGGYKAEYHSNATMIMNGAPAWEVSTTGAIPGDVSITTDFDSVNEVATLLAGVTGRAEFNVKVKFFPRTVDHPSDRGLKVRTSSGTTSFLSFPDAMCSTLDDTSGTSAISGTYTNETKLLLAALGQGADQDDAVCQDVISTIYATCGPTRQTAAAYCQTYLDAGKAKCLQDPGEGGVAGDSLSAFRDCMSYMCGQSVAAGCDHCDMGPLCDNSDCKSLPGLKCAVDGDCFQGAKCVSEQCSLEAGLGASCQGCHRVCADNQICDTGAGRQCRILVGQSGCSGDDDCVTGAVCDAGDCRIPAGGAGCAGNDDCVTDAVCEAGSCVTGCTAVFSSSDCGKQLHVADSVMVFADAKAYCEGCGSTMVITKTYDAVVCAMKFMIDNGPHLNYWSYAGLERVDGKLLWMDGTEQNPVGSPWRYDGDDGTGDCALSSSFGTPHDNTRFITMAACTYAIQVVCEKL